MRCIGALSLLSLMPQVGGQAFDHLDHLDRPAVVGFVTAVAWFFDVTYGEGVTDRLDWVLLAYRLPREPSTPRITLWRKLRRLGVVQVVDSLVALPADARTKEQLEWLADEVIEAGGEATVWVGRLASAGDERHLAARMAETIRAEYEQVIADADAAAGERGGSRRRTAARLGRQLSRVDRRDFFPPPERERARRAVEDLARAIVEVP